MNSNNNNGENNLTLAFLLFGWATMGRKNLKKRNAVARISANIIAITPVWLLALPNCFHYTTTRIRARIINCVKNDDASFAQLCKSSGFLFSRSRNEPTDGRTEHTTSAICLFRLVNLHACLSIGKRVDPNLSKQNHVTYQTTWRWSSAVCTKTPFFLSYPLS